MSKYFKLNGLEFGWMKVLKIYTGILGNRWLNKTPLYLFGCRL